MAIVQFQFRVEGVLTDPDSVVLADPTDSYGVKRNDTNATVVAADTEMSHDGTGLFSYNFSEPAVGLTYTAYIKYVRNSATTFIPNTITGSTTGAAGYYADQSDIEDIYGTANVATYSNLAGNATADGTRIQASLDNADAYINNFFRGGPYAVPLPVGTTTTQWAATLAGEWLYQARGFRDDDPVSNRITEVANRVRREMAAYKCEVSRPGWARSNSRIPQIPTAC